MKNNILDTIVPGWEKIESIIFTTYDMMESFTQIILPSDRQFTVSELNGAEYEDHKIIIDDKHLKIFQFTSMKVDNKLIKGQVEVWKQGINQ